ncbi:MAG: malto-oligosyltrehalose trehalohydrolase [Terriglobales bacterium]
MLTTEILTQQPRIGARRLPDGSWEFLLWAPNARSVRLQLCLSDELINMELLPQGYFRANVRGVDDGTQYLYRLDDHRSLPDPASRFQPRGVHGPSQIVDTGSFQWTDQDWKGVPLESSIFYELHVGTYTREGTFDAVIPHFAQLADLGVTTIELMPIAQFPGSRNWGYDGVYPFAPQNSYGGPAALHRLVDSAHAQGLAVTLDVVYNHLGPEGNYLNAFGPYFTDRYRTPWGQAVNLDGQDSDAVRRFFIENALYWLEDYHFDALRLDAVHGIFDFGARHFLAELKSSVAQLASRLGRPLHIIAESDLNDSRLLCDPERGGYDLDAQWSDDFHHSVHRLLTDEDSGYYSDFQGIEPLAAALKQGWYYSGQYSHFRKRHHGNSPCGLTASKFVVFTQNHDQVGNRAFGDRMSALVDFESLKLAAGVNLLSPFVPLLFMGEEYGEAAPFQYFTSHGDKELVEAVRRGRREEFAAFDWEESVPDPQDDQTYERSHLDHALKEKDEHRTLLRFYQQLIRIRREFHLGSAESRTIRELGDSALLLLFNISPRRAAILFNFSKLPVAVAAPELRGNWVTRLDSAAGPWKCSDASLDGNGDSSASHRSPQDADFDASTTETGEFRICPRSFLVLEEHDRVEAA